MNRRQFLAGLGSLPLLGFAKRAEASPAEAKSSPVQEVVGSAGFTLPYADAVALDVSHDGQTWERIYPLWKAENGQSLFATHHRYVRPLYGSPFNPMAATKGGE